MYTEKEKAQIKQTIADLKKTIKEWNDSLASMLQKIKDTKTK